jgi:hypothetical protein
MRVLAWFSGVAAFAVLMAGAAVSAGADPGHDHIKRPERERSVFASGPASTMVTDNFEVVGHVNLGGGSPNGDVYFYDHGGTVGKYAYVGTWSSPCSGHGAKVIDVNDPSKPKVVARVGGRTGISNEDVVVERIGGRDVLGVGVQICKPQGAPGGMALFDVTNPRNPTQLSFLPTPAGGVHELDLVTRPDGTSLALLAVPFSEFDDQYFGTSGGGEFRIVDVTDPANPVEVADWGAIADSSLKNFGRGGQEISSSFQGLGYFAADYAHSARAADDGMTAYVSYWDAGILKFDISEPANPVLLARTQYGTGDDGDGHSMTPYDVGGTRYIFQNDEDLDALSPVLITSDVTGPEPYQGIDEPWAPTLLTLAGPVSGMVHDANDGCQASDFAGADGKVALVDTVDPFYVGIIPGWEVPCTIGSQVEHAGNAGAAAMLSNLISPDDAWPFGANTLTRRGAQVAEGMPIVQMSDIDGMAAELRAAGTATVTLTPQEPSFGYLRVFSEEQASDDTGDGVPEYEQVGSFSDLPNVTGVLFPPAGTWTIHNTEILGDRAYSSWYSHGIVALDLTDPTAPQFAGQFVPETSSRFASSLGPGPAEVWGVAIDPSTGLVYASDMRSGLWIVRPVGDAAPSD